jgi:hypothetical protein
MGKSISFEELNEAVLEAHCRQQQVCPDNLFIGRDGEIYKIIPGLKTAVVAQWNDCWKVVGTNRGLFGDRLI